MLYLDASALAKRYFNENGSELVAARFESGEGIFTSVLSFAEIHSVMARKFRGGDFGVAEFSRLKELFQDDWAFSLSKLELDFAAMTSVPRIVENVALRASDAIHLSTAIWLRDSVRLGTASRSRGNSVVFGAADKRLIQAAMQFGLEVFDPEADGE